MNWQWTEKGGQLWQLYRVFIWICLCHPENKTTPWSFQRSESNLRLLMSNANLHNAIWLPTHNKQSQCQVFIQTMSHSPIQYHVLTHRMSLLIHTMACAHPHNGMWSSNHWQQTPTMTYTHFHDLRQICAVVANLVSIGSSQRQEVLVSSRRLLHFNGLSPCPQLVRVNENHSQLEQIGSCGNVVG